MISLLLLAVATLASEDLTCIAAGLLVRRGDLHWSAAIAGCFLGIYLGDLGLWLLGRMLGRQVMRTGWLAGRLPAPQRLAQLGEWFDKHTATSVLAARFLPGTRLPVYVAAGALGRKGIGFAAWTFVAALLWTPLLVLLAASLGDAFAEPFRRFLGTGSLALVGAVLGLVVCARLLTLLLTEIGRARLLAGISRIWRWEFWPMWMFYPPVMLWIGWLSLRRRGFTTITAANPGILHGGFVGESKFQILSRLGSGNISPTLLIEPGELATRLEKMMKTAWDWPIILKPDVGQRGAGVKLVRSAEEAERYLAENHAAVIAQPYHPGPFEAGIFYYRYPGEARGHIFSITDKRFPLLIGDGVSTVEQLIWRDSRLRMQARTFLTRHQTQREHVLANGEEFRLALAGNHCQGTLFCDGGHLITPELELAIDRVARRFEGFYFGRFDVRYGSAEKFKAGEDFTVIELNGITSESTNLYDPSWSLLRAYGTLFRQWDILFRIGAMNRRRGHRASSLIGLGRDVLRYYRAPAPSTLAD